MNALPDMGYDEKKAGENIIKIAQITSAYENSEVIGWLTKRGWFIKLELWSLVDKVNTEIATALKKENSELLDNL
jgi:hypothetical protein